MMLGFEVFSELGAVVLVVVADFVGFVAELVGVLGIFGFLRELFVAD